MDLEKTVARDVLGLVKRFVAKGSSNFKDFQEEWQQSQFYYIHCVGRRDEQKNAITEALFSAMTDIVVNPETPMIERLAALYVWYAVYCTQLSPGAVKVRLSLSEWTVVESLHQQMRMEECRQADYLLCLLKSYSAFSVCANRRKLWPRQYKEDTWKGMASMVEQQLIGPQSPLLQQLHQVHQLQHQYTELKESIREHLPPHLLTSPDDLEELLKAERLRVIAGERQAQEESPSPEDEREPEYSELPRRRRVLYDAYQSTPSTGHRH